MRRDARQQIYRLRLIVSGVVLICLGLAVGYVSSLLPPNVNHSVSSFLGWLSDLLVLGGGLGILTDVITGRQKAAAEQEVLRVTFDEKTPQIVETILTAFGESKDYLKNIASPELLDGIAANALSLRLGDDQFAREIYASVRDLAIRAPERWRDLQITIRLTDSADSLAKAPRLEALVEWEYSVAPSHPVARFACVSDRDEFYELTADVPATFAWFMTPRPGFAASKRECFELLSYSVDGEEQKIRRSERKTGQTYSVTLGDEVVRVGQPVRIRHLYRVVTPQFGHRLFFEIPQPARGISFTVDYTNTTIATLSVSELVTSIQKPRIARLPAETSAKVVQVDIDGWLLPRAGFTCNWTLESELPASERAATATSSAARDATGQTPAAAA